MIFCIKNIQLKLTKRMILFRFNLNIIPNIYINNSNFKKYLKLNKKKTLRNISVQHKDKF